MTDQRIGFACKLSERDNEGKISAIESCNGKTTTVAWLSRQSRTAAEGRLEALVQHNLQAVHNLVAAVSKLPLLRRMVRISSDVLPVYTHRDWAYFYRSEVNRVYLAKKFAAIGELARANQVRLSFHPGQFCCIVSNNPGIVGRSIEELEYHAQMAEWMGYGQSKLDFKINVHLSGKLGVDGFLTAYNQMSPVLRSSLTLENDEYQAGLDTLLPLAPYIGIVLDIHHHYINTGEYITVNDPRLQAVQDSWAGRRPVIHYSQSQWEFLERHQETKPALATLLTETNRSKLRSHGEYYNHRLLNTWALEFLDIADLMCESKSKNLGVDQLLEQYT